MKTRVFILILLFGGYFIFAQEANKDNWDNQLYLSNKVTWNLAKWKFSGELQARLENNMQDLETLFSEGVGSLSLSDNLEITPDFRISKKPDEYVFRPGLGMFYKLYINEFQIVNQIKWQIDMHTIDGRKENALRYVVSINKQLSDKIIGTFLAGALYRWSDDFRGAELMRFGPGITYIFNRRYSLFINYYLSGLHNHQYWEWSGVPFFQLIINLNKFDKLLPKK